MLLPPNFLSGWFYGWEQGKGNLPFSLFLTFKNPPVMLLTELCTSGNPFCHLIIAGIQYELMIQQFKSKKLQPTTIWMDACLEYIKSNLCELTFRLTNEICAHNGNPMLAGLIQEQVQEFTKQVVRHADSIESN